MYPKIRIRSKNELAKRISGPNLSRDEALELINYVLTHKNELWRDNLRYSEPKKDKWVRDAKWSKYGKLLKLINNRVFAPYDSLLPNFIYGSVCGRGCKDAARQLLGVKKKRVLLKMDLRKFFEQNSFERVVYFLESKCECSKKGAWMLATLCCVNVGPKCKPGRQMTIARGFSTSPRLAAWCNVELFRKVENYTIDMLRFDDPRMVLYVDDIGITASRVSVAKMSHLYHDLEAMIQDNRDVPLTLNDKKTRIIMHDGRHYDCDGVFLSRLSFDFLGCQLKRNSLTIGYKTRNKLRNMPRGVSRRRLMAYKSYIEKS